MLRLMAEAPGEPISRERFLDAVWGYTAFPTTRTVDNHIASLRAKIEREIWLRVNTLKHRRKRSENSGPHALW